MLNGVPGVLTKQNGFYSWFQACSESMTKLKKTDPGEVSKYDISMATSWIWGCQDTNVRDSDPKAEGSKSTPVMVDCSSPEACISLA